MKETACMSNIKVVYWNNIPSPYMVDRFNALVTITRFEFEVWFNQKSDAERSWKVDEKEWKFKYRYVPSVSLFGYRFRFPLMLLERQKPAVIVMLHAEPVFIAGWLIARIRRIRTGFRVLLTHDRWVKRHWLKEYIKRYMFSRIDLIETHGKDGKSYAMRYGVPNKKVFITTHTVNLEYYNSISRKTSSTRESFRSDLGLLGIAYIYVGRLWWGKGVTYLLDAFHEVQKKSILPVSLLLVGDGKEESILRQKCKAYGIENVVFAGFQQKEMIPYYYAAADVFVFPTLGDPYGLVVDEAMACSLPIVSTTAAGEIRDRVDDGVNGFLVPPENSMALAKSMLSFASCPELCRRFGLVSRRKVESHSPEQWAMDFEKGITNFISASTGMK